jgi:hypothetical protein
MQEWTAIAVSYPGWSLKEIQEFSPRERTNWLEIARELGKVRQKKNV